MRYLSKASDTAGCVFCEKLASLDDIDNLVLWRGNSIAILMNLFPYSTGHIMLLPYEHIATPEQLDVPVIMTEIAVELPGTMRALRRVLNCQGFNTGMNTGGAAGAGIADHMHVHVVPRWSGDANFMPIVGKVTVMPELLSVTYAKLRAEILVEHDARQILSALVLSPDRSSVLLLPADGGKLPTAESDAQRPLVHSMRADLVTLGIEASVSGWAGFDTVVWQASTKSEPTAGAWIPISELPAPLALLASQARSRLEREDT